MLTWTRIWWCLMVVTTLVLAGVFFLLGRYGPLSSAEAIVYFLLACFGLWFFVGDILINVHNRWCEDVHVQQLDDLSLVE